MDTTTIYHPAIAAFLTQQGIKNELQVTPGGADYLTVDRTSMCHVISGFDENETYSWVAELIREHLATLNPGARFYWSGRTDDWLGVEVWT